MNFAEFFGSYHSPGRDAFDKGESLIKKSGYKLAIDSFKNASTLLKAEGKVAGQGFCYSRMGECYVVQDKVDEAIECFELALPLLESEKIPYVRVLGDLCEMHETKGHWPLAQELSKKRFNLTLDLDDDTEHAMSYAILSRIAFSQGEFEESLRLCDEGLPLTDDERPRRLLLNVASCACQNLQMFDRALDLRLDQIQIVTKMLGEGHLEVAAPLANALTNAAELYAKLKEMDKAVEYAEKAFIIRAKVLGATHLLTVGVQKQLEVYRAMAADKTLARDFANSSRRCAHCKQSDPGMMCSRCKRVHYCSRNCQLAAWNDHKTACKKI